MLTIIERLKKANAEDGFTLVEVMVAMMVFALLAVGIAFGTTNALMLTQNSRSRETAIQLASQDIDTMRTAAVQSIFNVVGVQNQTQTLGGVTYSLTRAVNWVSSNGGAGACGASGGTLAYKSIVDTVTWQSAHGGATQTAQMSSQIAPSSNINDASDGTILVNVITASGMPNQGVAVTVTADADGSGSVTPATQPSATDSQGCAYALKLVPGNYLVTLSETGGIDSNQNQPGKQDSVPVTQGSSTAITVTYDTATNFTVNYTPSTPAAVLSPQMATTMSSPVGGNDPFTLGATSTTQSPTVTAFPFSNYVGYAGTYVSATAGGSATCADTNPANWTTAASDGAVGHVVGVMSGTTMNIGVGVLTVSGLSSGAVLTATNSTYTPTDDPGCSATQTLTFPAATGSSQVIALPYGTWVITSKKGTTTTNVIAAKPSNVVVNTRGTVYSGLTGALSLYNNTVMLDPRTKS